VDARIGWLWRNDSALSSRAHYVVTEPLPGAFDELPSDAIRICAFYFRGEGDAVMLARSRILPRPGWSRKFRQVFLSIAGSDWEKFAEPLKNGKHRIPALETALCEIVNARKVSRRQ